MTGTDGDRSVQQSHYLRRMPRTIRSTSDEPDRMPELPEVETVRRGLAPVMEGARFVRGGGASRRSALAAAEGFRQAARRARPSSGLGRRAKYLLADLSSGEVLVMHLGMSGSFRVARDGSARRRRARIYHDRAKDSAHDHVVFHMSSARRHVQRSAPLRLDEARRARRSSTRSRCCARSGRSRSATHSTPRCWRQACAGKKTSRSRPRCSTSASSPGSATSMSARRCIRALLSPKRKASTIADRKRRAERARRRAGRRHQGGAQRRHRGRRLVAARSSPDRRRARLFPAQLPGL